MKQLLLIITLAFVISACQTLYNTEAAASSKAARENREYENKSDRDRVLHLKLKSNKELCNAHNNYNAGPKVLRDIKAILKTRGVQVCVTSADSTAHGNVPGRTRTVYYDDERTPSPGKYVGEFRDHKYHGQGTYTWADGDKYVGEFRDGKQHGQGTYTFGPSSQFAGDKYVGEWKDSTFHGQGTLTVADGSVQEGIFKDGEFQYARKDPKIEERIAGGKRETEVITEQESPTAITAEKSPPEPKAEAPKLDVLDTPYVALKNANVRERPDVKSPRVTTLSVGSEITALGKVKDKNWYLVSRDGKELGYVFGTLLGEPEAEPEISVAAAPEPKAVKATENKDAVAVIIGNKNYASAHYKVAYAHNDADAISEFVKKQLGYRDGNIIELKDATSGQFDAVFGTKESHEGKLFDWVRADQSDVIVYYSGHGVPGLEDRRGYLLPVDGDPDRARLTGYPLELLLDNLAKIPARSITVYLDACFSGGSHRGMLVRSASPILVTPKDVEGSQRMTVLTAASGDQLASWDEDKKHGLFTWHLLEALSGTADGGSYGDGNGEVAVSEVKKYLDAEMTYQARRRYGREQNVWISGEMERVLVSLSDALPVAEEPVVVKREKVAPEKSGDPSEIVIASGPLRGLTLADWLLLSGDRLKGGEYTALIDEAADIKSRHGATTKVEAVLHVAILGDLEERRGLEKVVYAAAHRRTHGSFDELESFLNEAVNSVLSELRVQSETGARDALNTLERLKPVAGTTLEMLALEGQAFHTLEDYGRAEVAYKGWLDMAPAAHGERKEIVEAMLRARLGEPLGPKVGKMFKDCPECPEMVVVPSGSFMMGSPESEKGRSSNEGPVHRVSVRQPFAIGKYEVTFAEWDACVSGGGCNGYRPDDKGWGRDKLPVINVSWKDATSYTSWLSRKTGHTYRLPSEAEWEYAARAGTTARYHFGDSISSSRANYGGNMGKTVPVGSYPENAFGLHDVHGNVWEWTEDCWNDSYAGAPSDTNVWKAGECSRRVFRGGSWGDGQGFLSSSHRRWYSFGVRGSILGFRIVRTLPSNR